MYLRNHSANSKQKIHLIYLKPRAAYANFKDGNALICWGYRKFFHVRMNAYHMHTTQQCTLVLMFSLLFLYINRRKQMKQHENAISSSPSIVESKPTIQIWSNSHRIDNRHIHLAFIKVKACIFAATVSSRRWAHATTSDFRHFSFFAFSILFFSNWVSRVPITLHVLQKIYCV